MSPTHLCAFAAVFLVRVSESFLITTGHCLWLFYLLLSNFTNFFSFWPSLLKLRFVVFSCQLLRSVVLAAFLYFADAFFIYMLLVTEGSFFCFSSGFKVNLSNSVEQLDKPTVCFITVGIFTNTILTCMT